MVWVFEACGFDRVLAVGFLVWDFGIWVVGGGGWFCFLREGRGAGWGW